MHGSLIDSHRRSSLNSEDADVLSSSERKYSDGEHTRKSSRIHQKIITPLKNDTNLPQHLDDVIEDDENTKKQRKVLQKIRTPVKNDTENLPVRLDGFTEDDEDEKEPTASVTHSADFFRWTHGHRRVMLTFGTICLFAFMTGVEY